MANVLKNNAASDVIAKLYLNEDLADVHFQFNVDDDVQLVPANKNILAALSPVFFTMFYGSLKEGNVVKIVDASADAFKEFLQFFYLVEVTLTTENSETVVRLADKYDILECVKDCATFLKNQLTPDNMCWGYQLAMILKHDGLMKFCEDEIIISANEVFASEAFRRCDKSTLERVLELKLACMETDVFDACLTWAKYACQNNGLDETQAINLKAQLGDCWKLIQFGSMNVKDFSKIYMSHKALFTPEEFDDIILLTTMDEYEPKIFNRTTIRRYMWDEANILRCQRKTRDSNPKKYIEFLEVTSFSSSHRVLLGTICTAYTYNNDLSTTVVGIGVEVTITEQKDLTLHSIGPPKILYKGMTNTYGGIQLIVTLPQPIFIKPQRIYEIRLKLPTNNGLYYYSDCKTVVEMADGIKIQFHRNPKLDYDNLATGWISDLFFNKI